MRDIRPDLRERLEAISKEQQSLQSRLSELEQTEAGVRVLLLREEQRYSRGSITELHLGDNHVRAGGTPLAKLIITTARQGGKRWFVLDDFKTAAKEAHFDFGEKSPGRTLHWALVGLTTHGHLECQGTHKDRRYRLKEAETEKRAAN